jgi:CRP-like cAMP-binding protein
MDLANCQSCAIRDVCVLGRLRNDEPALLEPHIRQRTFHPGDVLADEGKVATFVRIVKLGTVFGYRRGLDGRSRPIGVVSRGNGFGVFGVFDNPTQATGVALTTARVCEIPVVALRERRACDSKMLVSLGRSAVETCGAMATWSEAMRLPGVVNQLAYVVVLLADANKTSVVELPTHSALAQLLGTTRETVARALATLETEGGIRRWERKRCEVHRRNLLARVARSTR